MRIEANRKEGYELLHEGVVELSRVEANGIRIDTELLDQTKLDLKAKIKSITEELQQDEVWVNWRKRFGQNRNLTSLKQLSKVLSLDLGMELEYLEKKAHMKEANAKMDSEALSKIDHPFITLYGRMLKYEKALGTFLKGIEMEVVDGRLHPVFNLHTARTYRSSSDSPNFQNLPVRDKEIAKIIRSLFVPTEGYCLVENDFKGIEVSLSSCYHHDKNFISYITSPGKDMHRDMAAQLYLMNPEQVSKEARYGAKNKFVFPQFYGDFYVSCARSLWEWIGQGELKGPFGEDLYEHLRDQGITHLGACDPEVDPDVDSFEYHVQQVERDFWDNRFQQYGRWRKEWYREYLEKGYFDLLTGFRIHGSFRRNSVVSYPVQGSAFHCLLWTLIHVNKSLRKYRMKSKVVGQIHDSLIGDVHPKELRDYLSIVEEITTVKLRKQFDWLVVPLVIEYEMSGVDKSWYEKREFQFEKGKFLHPGDPPTDMRTEDSRVFLRELARKN